MKNKKVLKLVCMAISIALYFVLNRFCTISILNVKITISALPILVIAILYGPIEGLLVGLLGELMAQLLGYGLTITTILWIIPVGMRGLLVGLFSNKYKLIENHKLIFFVMIIVAIVVTFINTFVIFLDSIIYKYYSATYVFGDLIYRIIMGIISAFIYAILVPLIVKPLKEII